VSNVEVIDRRRPILFNGSGFTRINTTRLRELQRSFNAYVDRICTSPNAGNQVVETSNLLEYLLETEFCTRGTMLISEEIVELLISIRKVGNEPDEYIDTTGVLNLLFRVSEAVNTGAIWLYDVYDRVPEAREVDDIFDSYRRKSSERDNVET
jgi:hypothetical protein